MSMYDDPRYLEAVYDGPIPEGLQKGYEPPPRWLMKQCKEKCRAHLKTAFPAKDKPWFYTAQRNMALIYLNEWKRLRGTERRTA